MFSWTGAEGYIRPGCVHLTLDAYVDGETFEGNLLAHCTAHLSLSRKCVMDMCHGIVFWEFRVL